MSRQRYPEEFKIEAVKQVTEKARATRPSPLPIPCCRPMARLSKP